MKELQLLSLQNLQERQEPMSQVQTHSANTVSPGSGLIGVRHLIRFTKAGEKWTGLTCKIELRWFGMLALNAPQRWIGKTVTANTARQGGGVAGTK